MHSRTGLTRRGAFFLAAGRLIVSDRTPTNSECFKSGVFVAKKQNMCYAFLLAGTAVSGPGGAWSKMEKKGQIDEPLSGS